MELQNSHNNNGDDGNGGDGDNDNGDDCDCNDRSDLSWGGGGGLNSSMDRRDVLTRLSNPDDFYKLGKDYLCKQKQFMAETKPDPVLPNDCHTAENAGKLSTGN